MGLYIWSRTKDFNPRSYKRSDADKASRYKGGEIFQSTLLQEERHRVDKFPRCVHNFNPRSYKRSD